MSDHQVEEALRRTMKLAEHNQEVLATIGDILNIIKGQQEAMMTLHGAVEVLATLVETTMQRATKGA